MAGRPACGALPPLESGRIRSRSIADGRLGQLGFLAGPLTPVLDALATWTGSFGIAILILTLIVRLLLFPLQVKSMKSAAKMREIQPKLKELQEKYKDNPEELQRRMVALYQQHNMNPLGGCLPTLIQLPVMVSLYVVLVQFAERYANSPELQAAGIAVTFLGINMLEKSFIMGIAAGLTSLLMTFSVPADPMQRRMMAPMSLLTLYIGTIVPAGVALYISFTNLISALQQYLFKLRSEPAKEA